MPVVSLLARALPKFRMFAPVRNSVGSVAPAYLTPALTSPIRSLLLAAFTTPAISLAVPIVLAFCASQLLL